MGFPGSSAGKEATCNMEDLGSISGLGRSPGEGSSYPLQYSCLENSMKRDAEQATVHGVAKRRTRLNDFHFHFLSPSVCLEPYNFHNELETYLRTRNHLLHHLWFQQHLQYFPGQIPESEAEYFFPFVHLNSKHLKSNK